MTEEYQLKLNFVQFIDHFPFAIYMSCKYNDSLLDDNSKCN